MNIVQRIKRKIARTHFLFQTKNHRTETRLACRKLGTNYGGGYVPEEIIEKGSTCICAGAGEDISFDLELARRFSCRILIVDPTPRAKSHFNKVLECLSNPSTMPADSDDGIPYDLEDIDFGKIEFVDRGIWKENKKMKFYAPKNPDHVSHSILNCQNTLEFFEADCVTPATLIGDFGLQGIEVFKLDIETAEYDVIEQMMHEKTGRRYCVSSTTRAITRSTKSGGPAFATVSVRSKAMGMRFVMSTRSISLSSTIPGFLHCNF